MLRLRQSAGGVSPRPGLASVLTCENIIHFVSFVFIGQYFLPLGCCVSGDIMMSLLSGGDSAAQEEPGTNGV